MNIKRIIPKIDIKGPNLVKGINYEGLRVLGNPEYFAKYYYKDGADEIIYQDCVASLYNKKYILNFIREFSSDIYIPNCVGGGIKTLKDIEIILKNGADKVFINSGAINKPEFIDECVKNFGSSTIAISVEANKVNDNYYAFYDYGREISKRKIYEWMIEIQDRGAGEIILTSISSEGLGEGFDNILIDHVEKIIRVPLIINGGANSKIAIKNVLKKKFVSGVAISSMLHYFLIQTKDFIFKKKGEGNSEYLNSPLISDKHNFETTSIKNLKFYLKKNSINVRL